MSIPKDVIYTNQSGKQQKERKKIKCLSYHTSTTTTTSTTITNLSTLLYLTLPNSTQLNTYDTVVCCVVGESVYIINVLSVDVSLFALFSQLYCTLCCGVDGVTVHRW